MTYKDLKRLRRDHPLRNTPLGAIRAEYRSGGKWFPAAASAHLSYNDIFGIWRVPVTAPKTSPVIAQMDDETDEDYEQSDSSQQAELESELMRTVRRSKNTAPKKATKK